MGFMDELLAENAAARKRAEAVDAMLERYNGASLRQVLNTDEEFGQVDAWGFEDPYYPHVAAGENDTTLLYWYGWKDNIHRPLLAAQFTDDTSVSGLILRSPTTLWSYGRIYYDFMSYENPDRAVWEAVEAVEPAQAVGRALIGLAELFPPDYARLNREREASRQASHSA